VKDVSEVVAAEGRRDSAHHVELSTTRGAGNVEGDNLGANEVVAGGDVRGHLEVDLATVGVHVLSAPVLRVRGDETGVIDLEPTLRPRCGGSQVIDLCTTRSALQTKKTPIPTH
jgi:hypothetical protein